MIPGGLLTVVFIQLTALLVPIAIGLAGVISGGTAGFLSTVAWFLLGIPLSYAAIDTSPAGNHLKPDRSRGGGYAPAVGLSASPR